MRISEAFYLYLEDYIRFKNQSIRIEESHEFCERTLIYEIGDKQIEELTLADIRRMTATNIQLLIRNSAKRAGIKDKVTPHTLRHSFATNFLQNNGNMRYLAELLGHSSLETTQMYANVVNNDLQSAYEKYHTI